MGLSEIPVIMITTKVQGQEFISTSSTGISQMLPHITVDTLIDVADLNLYQAKEKGLNKVIL